ncbi:MAG: S-methyl-5-thioribose-1-phosphate isomerase [Candidatus Hydrogenedentes bacterium]|nr:S-methyl-5-thioribose-1-phosphate isomerase [Candidatus Hydrogenedentota bacterium]
MNAAPGAINIVSPLEWEAGRLTILDQTLLPQETRRIELATLHQVHEAIRSLRVRGAPAIGCCAAFGVLVGVLEKRPDTVRDALRAAEEAAAYLAAARPTAVNLFWAVERMRAAAVANAGAESVSAFLSRLEGEAVGILEENRRICLAIGEHGAALVHAGDGVLTHCNAGPLATAGYGTALAVVFRAWELGRRVRVFAGETRPLLQGARLTAWELAQAGIDVTLICDNMAAQVMREGRVQLVVVGADRIAANGDTANKIGTYGLALLAQNHGIPFYVAAPSTTFDFALRDGAGIPIEERSAEEVTEGFGRRTAPEGIRVYNPAFDVTPAELIAGFITEKGVLRPPYLKGLEVLGPGGNRT